MTDTTTIVPDQTPDGENNAIPLKEAAKRFGFTLSTLRTEDRRGRLTTYRIGKKLFTNEPKHFMAGQSFAIDGHEHFGIDGEAFYELEK